MGQQYALGGVTRAGSIAPKPALRRGITADLIAINDINLAAVEARRRFRVHFTMWEADRSGLWRAMYASRQRASIATMRRARIQLGSAPTPTAIEAI